MFRPRNKAPNGIGDWRGAGTVVGKSDTLLKSKISSEKRRKKIQQLKKPRHNWKLSRFSSKKTKEATTLQLL
jgi:hypothetical protein